MILNNIVCFKQPHSTYIATYDMPHTQRHKYAMSVYILMVKLVKNSEQLPPIQLILADNLKIDL
jgi:hypothetical protein